MTSRDGPRVPRAIGNVREASVLPRAGACVGEVALVEPEDLRLQKRGRGRSIETVTRLIQTCASSRSFRVGSFLMAFPVFASARRSSYKL